MSQEPKSLLEDDRIDEMLEGGEPPRPASAEAPPELPQTVVVVQYRTSKLPWLLLLAVILAIPVIGYVAYDQFIQRVDWQASRVARDTMEQLKAQKPVELVPPAPIRNDLPLALAPTSQPFVQTQEGAGAATAPKEEHARTATPKSDSHATKVSEATASGPARVVDGPPLTVDAAGLKAPPSRSPTAPREPVAIGSPPANPSRSPFDDLPSSDEPAETPFGATASRTAATAKASPEPTKPVVNPPRIEPAPPLVASGAGAAPAAAPAAAAMIQPAAAPADPPLPSREETDRQIREEAARKKAEVAHGFEQRQAEERRMEYEDRVRFHQDLRVALEQNGNQAGEEIDQLAKRYGFKANPAVFARARSSWIVTKPLAWRANRIRALGLPETVILDLLSDDLHAQLRKPGGPRNSNEVRVRAALLLLKKCTLPTEDEALRSMVPAGRNPPLVKRR